MGDLIPTGGGPRSESWKETGADKGPRSGDPRQAAGDFGSTVFREGVREAGPSSGSSELCGAGVLTQPLWILAHSRVSQKGWHR